MYIGIDVGGTKCACVLGDENGRVLKKLRFATTNFKETIDNIIQNTHKLGPAKAIGVSCGGPLDEEKGIILSPPNLPGWDNVHLKEMLEKEFSVPCGVRNDANACAIAEWRFGAGRGTKNMVFLTFGTGMGSGLILNGKLYSGTNGLAGEVGHMRLAPSGPVGFNKSGSFEGFCSGGGLKQLGEIEAQKTIKGGKKPAYYFEGFTAQDIAKAAYSGDETALRVFDICAEKLGEALAVIIDIINPEMIIIGSIFARCRDLLEKGMYKALEREALEEALKVCRICPPELSENIGDAAALAVAAEAFDETH